MTSELLITSPCPFRVSFSPLKDRFAIKFPVSLVWLGCSLKIPIICLPERDPISWTRSLNELYCFYFLAIHSLLHLFILLLRTEHAAWRIRGKTTCVLLILFKKVSTSYSNDAVSAVGNLVMGAGHFSEPSLLRRGHDVTMKRVWIQRFRFGDHQYKR